MSDNDGTQNIMDEVDNLLDSAKETASKNGKTPKTSKAKTKIAAQTGATDGTAPQTAPKAPKAPKVPKAPKALLDRAEVMAAAKAQAAKAIKRGRALTHVIISAASGFDLIDVSSEATVGNFADLDKAWDKVRELKAGDCPQIKCWRITKLEQLNK